MKRIDALSALAQMVTPDDLVVSWRSTTWRDWRAIAPVEARNTLPLVILGSITATALGLAISLPHRRVVALESDGSALMNTGIMATLGKERPDNLTVIVLDNGVYESIGAPPTLTSFNADLAKMAEGAGCPNCSTAFDLHDFEATARSLLEDDEVGYLVAKIKPGSPETGRGLGSPSPTETDGVEDKYRFLRYVEQLENITIHPDPRRT